MCSSLHTSRAVSIAISSMLPKAITLQPAQHAFNIQTYASQRPDLVDKRPGPPATECLPASNCPNHPTFKLAVHQAPAGVVQHDADGVPAVVGTAALRAGRSEVAQGVVAWHSCTTQHLGCKWRRQHKRQDNLTSPRAGPQPLPFSAASRWRQQQRSPDEAGGHEHNMLPALLLAHFDHLFHSLQRTGAGRQCQRAARALLSWKSGIDVAASWRSSGSGHRPHSSARMLAPAHLAVHLSCAEVAAAAGSEDDVAAALESLPQRICAAHISSHHLHALPGAAEALLILGWVPHHRSYGLALLLQGTHALSAGATSSAKHNYWRGHAEQVVR